MGERQFAVPTNPYALSERDLDRLRTKVCKAEAEAKAATDWTAKTRLEQSAKSLRRELNSAELARKEEDRASQARFDRRYMSVNESKGLPEFATPVYYFEQPEKPKLKPVKAAPKTKPVVSNTSYSEHHALVQVAVEELRRAGAA